ncbi:IS110 family transposase [Gluconobacter kondonii]|uniref:IS110 family transposase n=1 Tax=Gluconobacter kondonii TaxID=941463 RepID=UPI0020A026C7|nr:IS110 family transposase [Gluconobacter kondonii]MCP1237958.1 IS110 family transposase [Gluconobacter kondonii]
MDSSLKAFLESQISELEQRIEGVIAEMPELGHMTATEAAAMTGLAPMSHDSGAMRGKRVISGGRRSLRHVLFQAGLAASCHNPVLKVVAKRMKDRGKPHKLIIIAIARRLITIANAILKTGLPWRISPVA